MFDQMRRQTEDIIRYYAELNRRIANSGMENIGHLLAVSKQLENAVSEVAPQELEWVGAEIKRLLDRLVQMDTQLQRLRELKAVMDGGMDHDEQPRKRSAL